SDGRYGAAAEQLLEVAQIRRAKPGYGFMEILHFLSWLQLKDGKPQDAERSLREGFEVLRPLKRKDYYKATVVLDVKMANALFQQNKLSEAERYCHDAVAAASKYQGEYKEGFYHAAAFWLLRVLKAQNKLVEAQSVLDEMLARERRIAVAVGLLSEAV